MFSGTFSDSFLAEYRDDYIDEDSPDEGDTKATPASPIHSQPSRSPSSSPSPLANKSHTLHQKSMLGWDICKPMCQAGGSGLKQAIAAAYAAMHQGGLPVASERAGGDGR